MIRNIAPFFLMILASGCTTAGSVPSPKIVAMRPSPTLIVVSPATKGTCYTRVMGGLPRDRICASGVTVTYTNTPDTRDLPYPPPWVLKLFDETRPPHPFPARPLDDRYRPPRPTFGLYDTPLRPGTALW